MDDPRPEAPRGRILLIDDDRVFGVWATKVLQARGFEIKHLLDPLEGLRLVESERWDLVITDVEMPRLTGLEFLERVRRLDSSLPVVVVTSHPSVARAVTTLREAGTEFIQKPMMPDDLAARVASLIAQRPAAPAGTTDSVLAIGAHPGDVEIGAAGTLLAHQAEGLAVTILTLSRGVPGPAGTGDGREPEGAAPVIGTRVSLDDLGNASTGQGDAVVAAIDKLIARTQPAVVYTHSAHDAQQDHRDAHAAVLSAAWKIGRVYCFQSPSETADFRPTHFVAIDDHIDGKLRAVRAFDSQPEVHDYLDSDLVTSTARYWSRYCEARHAEAFEVVRDRATAGAATSAPGPARATR